MAIGKRIAEIRRLRKITQQELSRTSGVDYDTLRKIETEKTKNPSPEAIKKIANALNIESHRLLEEQKPNTQGGDLLPFIQLTPDQFERLILFILIKDKNFTKPEIFGGRGDKQRDIIAKKNLKGLESKKSTLFQAKRYKKIKASELIKELEKIKKHFFDNKNQATPIEGIVFCLADSPSPSIKDTVKSHAALNKLPEPIFWDARILDASCKQQSEIINEFFGGHIAELKKGISEVNELTIEGLKLQKNSTETLQRIESNIIAITAIDDAEMQKARRLMAEKKYRDAEEILLTLRTKIEKSSDAEKLKKLYNNLGVCFSKTQGKDGVNKAIELLQKAIDLDSKFHAPKQNKIEIIINNGIEKDYKYAMQLAKELHESDKKNLEYITIYLHTLNINNRAEEAKELIESRTELNEESSKSEDLSIIIALIYIRLEDIKNAGGHVDRGLKNFSESIMLNRLKGSILMTEAEKHGMSFLEHELIPFFQELSLVEDAVRYFEKALSLAEESNLHNYMKDQLKLYVYTTRALLHKGKMENFKILQKLGESITEDNLSTDEKRNKILTDISIRLSSKRFQEAYELTQDFGKEYGSKYEDIITIAKKFLWHSSPEFGIKLLLPLIEEAKEKIDFEYWAFLSTCFALLGDKNSALRTLNEAKNYFVSKDKDIYRKLLSHYAALAGRYRDNSESERFVSNILELQQITPEEKIVMPIKAIESDGSLSAEIKDFLKNAQQDYKMKRDLFKSKAIPVYFLEREDMFNKSFPEVMEIPKQNYDFDFTIPYNALDEKFLEKQNEYFSNGNLFIIDYSSLLNFAQTGQLGLFKALGKQIAISEYLLFKVQKDLMTSEIPALRDAWNFIRSDEVEIIPHMEDSEPFPKKMREFFDDWLVQEINYCIKEQAILITDDLRLWHYMHSKEIKGKAINSFIFFQEALQLGALDKRQYSLVLGNLADTLYEFIPFNGEDLVNIVSDDDLRMRTQASGWIRSKTSTGEFKISRRAYHLLNQIRLPGSEISSFLTVSLDFLKRLLRLGIPEEEKIDWTVFLTNFFEEFISKDKDNIDIKLTETHIRYIAQFWSLLLAFLQKKSRDMILEKTKEIKNKTLQVSITKAINFIINKEKS